MWNRQELKERGKAAFKRNYGACVVVSIILGLLTAASGGSSGRSAGGNGESIVDTFRNAAESAGVNVGTLVAIVAGAIGLGLIIGLVIKLLVKNPFIVGCKSFFLRNTYENAPVGSVLDGFKGNYGKVVLTMFLKDLFIGIGFILLVIPGIIMTYSYRMVPYILAENPDMEASEILSASKEMMNGHKLNAFVLDLSFFGWFILTVCTCGILGVFYVNPYVYATDAELYQAIR